MDKKEFLKKFYDHIDSQLEEGDYHPVVLTDSKKSYVEYLSSGEIVDNHFLYADTMSVIMKDSTSCGVNFIIIDPEFNYKSSNLTLQFRDIAKLCGYPQDLKLYDMDEDDFYMESDTIFLTKEMEKSLMKQLSIAISKQFADKDFNTPSDKKIEVNQLMKTTVDYYELEDIVIEKSDLNFIKKYKLEDELCYVGDSDRQKIKPSILVELDRTKDCFSDQTTKEEKFSVAKEKLERIIKEVMSKNDISLEWKVKGSYSHGGCDLYLEIEELDFKHSFLEINVDDGFYVDAPSSWSWAAWLIADESPIKDDDFLNDYCEMQSLNYLIDQLDTIENSDYREDLIRFCKDF